LIFFDDLYFVMRCNLGISAAYSVLYRYTANLLPLYNCRI